MLRCDIQQKLETLQAWYNNTFSATVSTSFMDDGHEQMLALKDKA